MTGVPGFVFSFFLYFGGFRPTEATFTTVSAASADDMMFIQARAELGDTIHKKQSQPRHMRVQTDLDLNDCGQVDCDITLGKRTKKNKQDWLLSLMPTEVLEPAIIVSEAKATKAPELNKTELSTSLPAEFYILNASGNASVDVQSCGTADCGVRTGREHGRSRIDDVLKKLVEDMGRLQLLEKMQNIMGADFYIMNASSNASTDRGTCSAVDCGVKTRTVHERSRIDDVIQKLVEDMTRLQQEDIDKEKMRLITEDNYAVYHNPEPVVHSDVNGRVHRKRRKPGDLAMLVSDMTRLQQVERMREITGDDAIDQDPTRVVDTDVNGRVHSKRRKTSLEIIVVDMTRLQQEEKTRERALDTDVSGLTHLKRSDSLEQIIEYMSRLQQEEKMRERVVDIDVSGRIHLNRPDSDSLEKIVEYLSRLQQDEKMRERVVDIDVSGRIHLNRPDSLKKIVGDMSRLHQEEKMREIAGGDHTIAHDTTREVDSEIHGRVHRQHRKASKQKLFELTANVVALQCDENCKDAIAKDVDHEPIPIRVVDSDVRGRVHRKKHVLDATAMMEMR